MELRQKFGVPVSEGILDAHFGHCKQYALIDIVDGNDLKEEIVDAPPHEPGLLPRWLSEKGVTDVIAGGMGKKAIDIFNSHNVNVFVGAPQYKATDLVRGFLDKSLEFTANYCDH